ncbi:MAG: glucosamine-6-phosphate deaminase [Spirochaetes bacterium]|nr:glucosamine-6-phosphate deaminase [Spirochaetota bacterium]
MRLMILDNREKAGAWAARYIAGRIKSFGNSEPFVLGLPTGSSPLVIYQEMVKMCRAKELSFKNVRTFNMDEYVGLPKEHPGSYHRFMMENLFDHVDIDPKHIRILDGMAQDKEKECGDYERAIKSAGGIELFLGGMGGNGHIAFNEPGSSFASRTRVIDLAQETINDNARFFDGDLSKVPKSAMSVGIGTIMDAREVVIIVTGKNKARALRSVIEEGVNHMYPLSCLQMHANATIVCDEDATDELRVGTVRYFKSMEKG